MEVALGIDIGGTSTKCGFVSASGEVVSRFSVRFVKGAPQERCAEALGERIVSEIESHPGFDVVGIGVGCPGSIDSKNGICDYSNNLRWENLPLASILEKITGLRVRLLNDANAALLGEVRHGVASDYENVVFLTLGTGVGSGLYLNGRLYEGAESKGAELGHMVIHEGGTPCTCGRLGCFESYASATGLKRLIGDFLVRSPSSSLAETLDKKGDPNLASFFRFVEHFDEDAEKVLGEYVRYLGEGILNIDSVFRPEAIVLGGGVSLAGEALLTPLIAYLEKYDYGFGGKHAPKVRILLSRLGNDAGLIGAASLAFPDARGYVRTLRSLVGNKPLIVANAVLLVLNKRNEVLLETRADDGFLDFPGGSLEFGESVEEAAMRELHEETGLTATNLIFLKTYSGALTHHRYPNGDEISGVDSVFYTHDYEGTLVAERQEVASLSWRSLDETLEPLSPRNKQILIDLKKRLSSE
ncbi:MAG: ROK family protein [Bacilli bacterium]|jgi:glucokinase|nr:ROK family protein [Bacilli bacterium]